MISKAIIILIVVIIGVIVLAFLFKSFAKIILTLGLIYVLFHVAFIWNAEEINNKFNLISFIKPEYQQQAKDGLTKFVEKRDNNGVIDTETVEKAIDDLTKKVINEYQGKIKDIDKQKLIDDINTQIRDANPEQIESILKKLQEELSKHDEDTITPIPIP